MKIERYGGTWAPYIPYARTVETTIYIIIYEKKAKDAAVLPIEGFCKDAV